MQEPIVDVLGNARVNLESAANRMRYMLGDQPEPGTPEIAQSTALIPSMSGVSMDVRTLAQDIDVLVTRLQDRLGTVI